MIDRQAICLFLCYGAFLIIAPLLKFSSSIPLIFGPGAHAIVWLGSLLVLLAVYRMLYGQSFEASIIVLTLGFVLFVYMLLYPNYHGYDLISHYEVLRYWAWYSDMPLFSQGHEFSQAQLYYIVVGKTLSLLSATIGGHYYFLLLGIINYLLFLLYLIYGTRLILYCIHSTLLRRLAVLALVAWPANIIHASRFGNDMLLYLSFTACSYYFFRWRAERVDGNYVIGWLGIALGTKVSAGLLVITMALIILHDRYRTRGPIQLRPLGFHGSPNIGSLVLLAAGLAMGYGRNIYYIIVYDTQSLLMASAVQTVEFHPLQFLTFPLSSYLLSPYVDWHSGLPETEYFWVYFLKSLSFGEFKWNGVIHAMFLNGLLLAMILWMLLHFLRSWISGTLPKTVVPYIIYMAVLIAGLAYMRIFYYGHPWADARHIYPFVLFFLLAYTNMLAQYRHESPPSFALGVGLLIAYIATSLYHIGVNLIG